MYRYSVEIRIEDESSRIRDLYPRSMKRDEMCLNVRHSKEQL